MDTKSIHEKAKPVPVKPLRLTRRELELLEVEMRAALDCGAEDPDFVSIRDKVRVALGWRDC